LAIPPSHSTVLVRIVRSMWLVVCIRLEALCLDVNDKMNHDGCKIEVIGKLSAEMLAHTSHLSGG
jgi:hypothetical protein